MNLGSRLSSHLVAAAAAAAALVSVAPEADAGIVYRTYNTVIPANIDGLYVNVETGVTGATGGVTPGWDINPYGATNLQFFAATGTGYLRFPGSALTTVAGNLVAGTSIDAAGSYANATTAVTFGAAAGNWQLNAVNIVGFRFNAADGLPHYGWARIQVGAAANVRTLLDAGFQDIANTAINAGDTGAPTSGAFCFGDGSSTACPCANNSAVGAGAGCLNSLGSGGLLSSTGVASIAADTAVLAGSGMPNSNALFFQGSTQIASPFGDGLRCAGGSVVRLGTKSNVGGASQYPVAGDQSISVRGGALAGNTRYYQVWYRNAAVFCNAETFNLTNGYRLVWAP